MGIFDDAEIEVNDIPKDPFGFGNGYWPVTVLTVGEMKQTTNRETGGPGDKIGTMITWGCNHPDAPQMESLGRGNWQQLPVPTSLRGEIPWNPKSAEAKKVIYELSNLYAALGFSKDEFGGIELTDLVGRTAMAKIFPRQNKEGFWQFNIVGLKPVPDEGDGSGMNEFARDNGGKSDEDLLNDELNS